MTSGFLPPACFDLELVEFFSHANIGPRVIGSVAIESMKKTRKTKLGRTKTTVTTKRHHQEGSPLEPTEKPLNSALPFVQIKSPLLSVISIMSLLYLFHLHAFYEKMEREGRRLSASAQMRKGLSKIMEELIVSSAYRITRKFPGASHIEVQIYKAVPILIQNITDPSNEDPEVGRIYFQDGKKVCELFNPNCFRYLDFCKLLFVAKIDNISLVGDKEKKIISDQDDEIFLAKVYKNTLHK